MGLALKAFGVACWLIFFDQVPLAALPIGIWGDPTTCQTQLDLDLGEPPSTNNSLPMMHLLSSGARNTTALAISFGVPSRPRGALEENHLLIVAPGL